RYRTASPLRMCLVQAAIDWVRAGLERPIPEGELLRTARAYVDASYPDESRDAGALGEALDWARRPLGGTSGRVAILEGRRLPAGEWGYSVFDYLVAFDDGDAGRRAVADLMWRYAVSRSDAASCLTIAAQAYRRGALDHAEAAARSAAERDEPPGMFAL